VFQECRKCGITLQGVLHDMSKLHPKEFLEYANNYQQGKSPVGIIKQKYGISYSWLRHKGRNPHHWEYWIDNVINPKTNTYESMLPKQMPFKYIVEMVCDWVGTSKVYNKNNKDNPFDWNNVVIWYNKTKHTRILHPDTLLEIETIITLSNKIGWDLTAERLKFLIKMGYETW